MIACCSRYLKCSEEGRCVSDIEEVRQECGYRKKLKLGINYYSDKKGGYLIIGDRMYSCGKRAKYGTLGTYQLDKAGIEMLKEQLRSTSIICCESREVSKCMIEDVGPQERASCRVILTIDENNVYNIQNFNNRAIKHETAIEIRDALRQSNLTAAIESIGPIYKSPGGNRAEIPKEPVKNQIEKPIAPIEPLKRKVTIGIDLEGEPIIGAQISMFD